MFVVVGCVELLLEMDSIQRMLLRCCEAGQGRGREGKPHTFKVHYMVRRVHVTVGVMSVSC